MEVGIESTSRPWFVPAGSRGVSHPLCVVGLCCRLRAAAPERRAVEGRLCPCPCGGRVHVSAGCQVWGSGVVGLGRMDCKIGVSTVFVCVRCFWGSGWRANMLTRCSRDFGERGHA